MSSKAVRGSLKKLDSRRAVNGRVRPCPHTGLSGYGVNQNGGMPDW